MAGIAAPRLAEVVAERIEREVLDRGWRVGHPLGSEAELAERMGVSRAVLREAVRIVEHHRIARMRRGPGGGLFVTEPDNVAVGRAVELYLGQVGVDGAQLFEARLALELVSVQKASERLSEEGVRRLRETLEREKTQARTTITSEHPQDLHHVIAELSGNPAIALFVDVLAELSRARSVDSVADLDAELPGYRRAHERITEAIIAGDGALAQHAMRRHLEYVAGLSERGEA